MDEQRDQQRKGRGSNLTQEDRARGGRHSAQQQQRNELGRFAGKVSGSPEGSGLERSESESDRRTQEAA